jgi:hypothetical protein
MEKVVEGLETLAGVGPTSKTPPRLNEKKQEDHKEKSLCFSYHKPSHQSFQCSKRLHQAIAFNLIAYKEGGRNKNPWGKRQGAYLNVSNHIGMNGGT